MLSNCYCCNQKQYLYRRLDLIAKFSEIFTLNKIDHGVNTYKFILIFWQKKN